MFADDFGLTFLPFQQIISITLHEAREQLIKSCFPSMSSPLWFLFILTPQIDLVLWQFGCVALCN